VSLAARLFAGLVACLLIGLTPLAHADPPDPVWIAGYWDDDDFDNVVVFILGWHAIQAETPADTEPPEATVTRAELPDFGGIFSARASKICARAPPVLSAFAS
jgi:hypothetical protein